MVRCPTRFQLTELALGRTEGAAAERLLVHLDDCERCGSQYDSLTRTGELELELREAVRGSGEFDAVLPGGTLGRYSILRRIGSGGMGIVYEARQSNPVRRVALKVMNPIAATPSGLRRFEVEGEALARLGHPAIAHVYEIGRVNAPHGPLPFLAMELVVGSSPLEHAVTKRLDTRERIDLFLGICSAVEHAHQRGVLHRDLKPSNILVTEEGAPKVLDFGLARLMDRCPDATATASGQVLGTLAYMSPEQLATGAEAADVRSDVYSLGVVLAELITEKRCASPASGTMDFEQRTTTLLDALRRLTDRDLTAIVARSLEPDPERRYGSVSEQARDLERWRAGESIEARPWSMHRRVLRLAARYRRTTLALGVAGILILVGMGGTVTQLIRARTAESAALEEARAASATGRFLDELLSAGDPLDSAANPDRSVRDLLEEASRRLDTDSELTFETRTMLLRTLGMASLHLADHEAARSHLELRRALIAERYSDLHPHTLDAAMDVVLVALNRRRGSRALEELDRLASSGCTGQRAVRLAELRGRAYLGLRRYLKAEEQFDLALSLAADLAASSEPMGESLRAPASTSESALRRLRAQAIAGLGDHGAAAQCLRQVLADLEDTLPADHPTVAETRHALARSLVDGGQDEEARPYFEQALDSFERVLGPRNVQAPYVASDLGDLLVRMGETEQAILMYGRALQSLPARDPELFVHRRARVCVQLAMLLEESKEHTDLLEEAFELMGTPASGLYDRDHPWIQLAKSLGRAGLHVEATRLYRRLLAELEPGERDGEEALVLQNNLATSLFREGRSEEAEERFRGTLEVRQRILGPDHYRTAAAEANLACVLIRRGEHAEAEQLLEHAVQVTQAELGPDHARVGRFRRHHAEALLGLGRTEAAVGESTRALEVTLEAYPDLTAARVGDTYLVHGECLLHAGQPMAARPPLLLALEILQDQELPEAALLDRAERALASCERTEESSR